MGHFLKQLNVTTVSLPLFHHGTVRVLFRSPDDGQVIRRDAGRAVPPGLNLLLPARHAPITAPPGLHLLPPARHAPITAPPPLRMRTGRPALPRGQGQLLQSGVNILPQNGVRIEKYRFEQK